ncbi:MAG: hypothetical protein ACOYT4_05625 [Nanoarchaeota archaeon]
MRIIWLKPFIALFLIFCICFVSSSVEIKTDKAIYNLDDAMSINVKIVENNMSIKKEATVYFLNELNRQGFNRTIITNQDNLIYLNEDFLAGVWQIEFLYNNKSIKKNFEVKELINEDFSSPILGDSIQQENKTFSSVKLPIAFAFIAAVFGLYILVLFERYANSKRINV